MHEDCLYMSYCGDLSEVYIRLSSSVLHDAGSRAVLVCNDSALEGWEKFGNLVSLESLES